MKNVIATASLSTLVLFAAVAVAHEPATTSAPVHSGIARVVKCGTYDPPPDPAPDRRPIDLVICLDTSGSMTALIDSARAKLWDLVAELGQLTPTPSLRVGLLTYGTPGLSTAQRGWIVKQCDLTDDLDAVYAKMTSMRTSGGDEFVGWVLNDALTQMDWTHRSDTLKLVFVAGNESADQAREHFDFRAVCRRARSADITVNAIFCGDRGQGESEHWHEVALYGGGHYAAIDMQRGTRQVPTPWDDALRMLNEELNATYLPYGHRGQASRVRQLAQDEASFGLGKQTAASRVAAKASGLYRNAEWDLVDAAATEDFDLAGVPADALPEDMQTMTEPARQAHLDTMIARRADVQRQIQELSVKREAFLAAEASSEGAVSLDSAIRAAIREQAAAKGFAITAP